MHEINRKFEYFYLDFINLFNCNIDIAMNFPNMITHVKNEYKYRLV